MENLRNGVLSPDPAVYAETQRVLKEMTPAERQEVLRKLDEDLKASQSPGQ